MFPVYVVRATPVSVTLALAPRLLGTESLRMMVRHTIGRLLVPGVFRLGDRQVVYPISGRIPPITLGSRIIISPMVRWPVL